MVTKAVFCDALGTVLELDPPWIHLGPALGVPVDDRLETAVRREMAYYRDHAHEGTDEATLADLRRRCAALLGGELGREVPVDQLLAAIRFRPAADAGPALAGLRELGLTLVCVSNWDISLAEVLERCGLRGAFDGVVSSAAAGARKPDPAIFAVALELAGCLPAEALHVGDTPTEDAAGAAAAGIPSLLLDRDGEGEIASLAEIQQHLRS